jgi:hypothetical protein
MRLFLTFGSNEDYGVIICPLHHATLEEIHLQPRRQSDGFPESGRSEAAGHRHHSRAGPFGVRRQLKLGADDN